MSDGRPKHACEQSVGRRPMYSPCPLDYIYSPSTSILGLAKNKSKTLRELSSFSPWEIDLLEILSQSTFLSPLIEGEAPLLVVEGEGTTKTTTCGCMDLEMYGTCVWI